MTLHQATDSALAPAPEIENPREIDLDLDATGLLDAGSDGVDL